MAITKVQVPKEDQGGGFLGILGNILKIGSAVGSAYASGGAMLAADAPGVAGAVGALAGAGAGTGSSVQAAGALGNAINSVKNAADLGGSVYSAGGAAKNLVAPPESPSGIKLEPAQATKPSTNQEIMSPSRQLQEAIQAASSIPEYQSQIPMLQDAYKKAQRQDFLAMRRGGY